MRPILNIICVGTIALFVLYSCTSKKGRLPAPAPAAVSMGCDTANLSYSKSVQPILQANCYACHSTAVTSSGGGLDLQDFSSLKSYLVYQFQSDGLYGSKFIHIIDQSLGVIPMPPSGKIPDCDRAMIGAWIRNGAPQN